MTKHTKLLPARLIGLVGGAFALTIALAACGGSGNDSADGGDENSASAESTEGQGEESGGDGPAAAVDDFLANGVEEFANSLAEADYEAVVATGTEYFCAEDITGLQELADQYAELSAEEQEMMAGQMSEFAVPEDFAYEIGEVTEEGDTATVNVSITAEGETTEEPIDVVKEEEEWKICGFGM